MPDLRLSNRPFRRFRSALLTLIGFAGFVVPNAGCQESAAVTTAVAAVQSTAAMIEQVPKWVQDLVTATQRERKWGKPESIWITDSSYVFLYPTSAAERKRNHGLPRMIVINRSDGPQSL